MVITCHNRRFPGAGWARSPPAAPGCPAALLAFPPLAATRAGICGWAISRRKVPGTPARPPGPALDELSGPQWRCDGATDDELIGLLGRWAAAESWVAAAKLGVLRELIRRRAVPIPGTMRPGGLPATATSST
jgi:hypothetical protein